MNWEEDRKEYLSSGRFKSSDEISRKILERAEARSSTMLLYFCFLIFGIGLLCSLMYFLI